MPPTRPLGRARRGGARVALLLAAVALLAAACGGGADGGGGSDPAPGGGGGAGAPLEGSITVLAASSLSGAFPAVAEAFEGANPGAEVDLSFAGSSTVAAQVRGGAPADVIATADTVTLDALVADGLAGEPEVFATNRLEIVVEPGNPRGISGLEDLADPDLLYVTAAPQVPIARYARAALEAAGATVTPVSEEADVKGIVTKVAAGEADAGIVYATDVVAAGDDVGGVALPQVDLVAAYPAAVLAEAGDPDVAEAFLAFLRSDEGQAVLARFGFGPP